MSTRTKWEIGDLCYVEIEGIQYEGKVLDWDFAKEGNFLFTKIEINVRWIDWEGKEHSMKQVYPKPIQSYKLRKRVA